MHPIEYALFFDPTPAPVALDVAILAMPFLRPTFVLPTGILRGSYGVDAHIPRSITVASTHHLQSKSLCRAFSAHRRPYENPSSGAVVKSTKKAAAVVAAA